MKWCAMPSDFEPISQTVCVGCGRGSDQVALKRLSTYSRAFGCLTCYMKFSNCGNCQHVKHGSYRPIVIPGAERQFPGSCPSCGCTEYKHGLAAEFDRQFDTHTGKTPLQIKCNHCGNWFDRREKASGIVLFCARCEDEWRSLNG